MIPGIKVSLYIIIAADSRKFYQTAQCGIRERGKGKEGEKAA
jgi:hypothetical protein